MKNGLYEKVLDKRFKERFVNKEFIEIRNIDNSELPSTFFPFIHSVFNILLKISAGELSYGQPY